MILPGTLKETITCRQQNSWYTARQACKGNFSNCTRTLGRVHGVGNYSTGVAIRSLLGIFSPAQQGFHLIGQYWYSSAVMHLIMIQ